MDKDKVIKILLYVLLGLSGGLCLVVLDYGCADCNLGISDNASLVYSNAIGGFETLIIVCIAMWTGEELSKKLKMTSHYLLAILYIFTAIFLIVIYVDERNTLIALLSMILSALCAAGHLFVAITVTKKN